MLIQDWKRVLRRAWSVRLMLFAALASGAEVALPLVVDHLPYPPGALAMASFGLTTVAMIARFYAQSSMKGDD